MWEFVHGHIGTEGFLQECKLVEVNYRLLLFYRLLRVRCELVLNANRGQQQVITTEVEKAHVNNTYSSARLRKYPVNIVQKKAKQTEKSNVMMEKRGQSVFKAKLNLNEYLSCNLRGWRDL